MRLHSQRGESSAVTLDFLRQCYYAQPREVSFETLAVCNAACVFCPYPTLERKGVCLPSWVIDKLIAEMAGFREPFFISPFKVNDPLLDTRMQEICEQIEEKIPQATLRLFTNGSMLTERHLAWIAELKHLDRVRGLWISLNSCDPQEYGELMKLNFSITAHRLDVLHQSLVEDCFPYPVTVSRVMRGSLSCPEQLATGRDLKFSSDVARRWPRFRPLLIKDGGWIGYSDPTSKLPPRSGCERWFELSVTATGKVALCCMDGEAKYALGDVTDQTLLEVYNQPLLKRRRLEAFTREGIDPCARCTY